MEKLNSYIKYPLLLVSIVLIFMGVIREEHLVVLKKAVSICLECVGLG